MCDGPTNLQTNWLTDWLTYFGVGFRDAYSTREVKWSE